MELLLILLIIFFVLPWVMRQVTPWLLQWFIRRQTRRFMDGTFGRGNFTGNATHTSDRRDSTRHKHRSKKIDPSVGEYIEFTEIKGTTTSSTVRPSGPVESQITDIEWEDLS